MTQPSNESRPNSGRKAPPQSARALVEEGHQLASTGKKQAAFARFQTAVTQRAGFAPALLGMAEIHLQSGQTSAARTILKSVDQWTEDGPSLAKAAGLLLQLRCEEEAERAQPVRWQQREPTEPPSNAFVERREESFGDSRRPWVILKNQPAAVMSSPWSGGAPFSESSTNLKKPRNTRRTQTTSGCLRPKPRLGTSGQLWLIKPMTMKPRSKHGPKLELSKANSRNGEDLTAHFGLDRFKPGPNGARTLSKA